MTAPENSPRRPCPDSSFLSYAYNNAHLLTTITNRLSETQNLSYNSAGNLTQTLWKNSGGTTKRQHTATFDALGRMLTDVGGVSQTTTFGYDSNSNVTHHHRSVEPCRAPDVRRAQPPEDQ